MLTIAIIGTTHWHLPLYLAGIARGGGRISAVWDRNHKAALAFAEQHKARCFADINELIACCRPDLALILGRPVDMVDLARPFIRQQIPLMLEKPAGLNPADITVLEQLRQDHTSYVAVALIQRYSGLGPATAHTVR